MTEAEKIVELWKLLDDIDTLDDACKGDDASFRKLAYEVQRKRFDAVSGEDFDALSELIALRTAPSGSGVKAQGTTLAVLDDMETAYARGEKL